MSRTTTTGVTLAKATKKDLRECVEITMDSVLGEKYFSRDIAEGILAEGIAKKQVTVARTSSEEIVGLCRLVLDGMCLVFAYINVLVVKSGYRGRGVGKTLLLAAEKEILHEDDYPFIKKSFLLVGKANRKARAFYEAHDYKKVATLPDLFAENDTEYLMVKELGRRKQKN